MKSEFIHIDSEILRGTPCFAGTRIPVDYLYDYLEAGDSIDEFIRQYPTVGKAAIIGVLELSRKSVAA